jgi:histidinol-phosphate aminotransferase
MDVRGLAKPWVFGLGNYVPGETREGCIKLASNENNYGPSPRAIEAVREAMSGVHMYPYKNNLLEEKVAEYAKVSPKNVVCGNGSDELIELVLKAFRGPAAGFRPSFSGYKVISEALGTQYSDIPLNREFGFDAGEFVKKNRGANIFFLANPNNPTGGIIGREDIERVLDAGKITVVDEAYFEFYGKTVSGLIGDYPNLIVLRTFSKAFGLGGLRVGYAIAAEETSRLLLKVRPPFSVNALAHEAALAALDDVGYMGECVKKILADREKYGKILAKKLRVYPSFANFWPADVSPMSAQEFFERMIAKKIVVRKFGNFPGFLGEYVRITVGRTDENEKLASAVAGL